MILKPDPSLTGPKVTRQKFRLAPKRDQNSTGLKVTRQKIRLALKLDQNSTGPKFTRQKSLALKADRNSMAESGPFFCLFYRDGPILVSVLEISAGQHIFQYRQYRYRQPKKVDRIGKIAVLAHLSYF